jgi:hypothetical protein
MYLDRVVQYVQCINSCIHFVGGYYSPVVISLPCNSNLYNSKGYNLI